MALSYNKIGNYIVIRLRGFDPEKERSELAKKIEQATSSLARNGAGIKGVVFDLSETTYVDSHTIGHFVHTHKTLMENEREACIMYDPKEKEVLHESFKLLSLTTVMKRYDNIEDLLKASNS